MATPGNLLDVQVPQLHCTPTESETLGLGPPDNSVVC